MRAELRDLPQGWFHHGEQVLALVEAVQPAVCVELGTWRGASAIAIARVLRRTGGRLYCVDTWAGQVCAGGTVAVEPAMIGECARNLGKADVADLVRLIPTTTCRAARAWAGPPIDFLYVDADHARDSVMADLESWWPHLRDGGLIAGDDYDSTLYPGTTQAWDTFERAHGQTFARVATPHTDPPGMRLIYGTKDGGRR